MPRAHYLSTWQAQQQRTQSLQVWGTPQGSFTSDFQKLFAPETKASFFNKSLVFVNSKRLRIDKLWTLRCSFCQLLPCLPSQCPSSQWKFSSCPLHLEAPQHLVFPHLHQDLYLPSLTFTHTCKSLRSSCPMSHAKNTYFISSQLHFGSVRGAHPRGDCPPHNLISPAPVPVPAPCVESSRWMNLKGPLVTWNKLQFPYTIKSSFLLWSYL